jgi:hypothetical protein
MSEPDIMATLSQFIGNANLKGGGGGGRSDEGCDGDAETPSETR